MAMIKVGPTKSCNMCGETKSRNEFYRSTFRGQPNGWSSYCIECHNAWAKSRQARTRAEVMAVLGESIPASRWLIGESVTRPDLRKRVEARLDKGTVVEDRGFTSPCRIWIRNKTNGGYGQMMLSVDGVSGPVLTHALSWSLANNAVMVPNSGKRNAGYSNTHSHLCHQEACCEPSHIVIESLTENLRRKAA